MFAVFQDVLSNSRVNVEISQSTSKRIAEFYDRSIEKSSRISRRNATKTFCNEFLRKNDDVRREKNVRFLFLFRFVLFSSTDGRSSDQIRQIYFPTRSISDDQWLKLYDQCVWLAIEGLYICVARYNRHYRGLFRLAHFFHTNEYFRNQRLSIDIFLGGQIFELKNYPKIIGLFQERSKHNLFNVKTIEFQRFSSKNVRFL